MKGKLKGNSFEWQISKKLSKFISNGKRDDIFAKSQNSGARQTIRKKQGKETYNQAGDICSNHPDGENFIKLFCLELKHYREINFFGLITESKSSKIISFWEQAKNKADEEGKIPILIVRQNNKPILWISEPSFHQILYSYINIKPKIIVNLFNHKEIIHIFKLDDIFEIDPKTFNYALMKKLENEK